MTQRFTNFMFYIVILSTTMAAIISPIHAKSRSRDLYQGNNMASPFSDLVSDVKSVRLINACRQHVGRWKDGLNPVSLSSPNSFQNMDQENVGEMTTASYLKDADYPNSQGLSAEVKNKLVNIVENTKSYSYNLPLVQEESPMTNSPFSKYLNDNLNKRFPIYSPNRLNNIDVDPEQAAFEIMEQMCLKYAFDKLLQSQNREQYLASKKVLENSNDVTRLLQFPEMLLPENKGDQNSLFSVSPDAEISQFRHIHHSAHPDRLVYNDGLSFSNVDKNNLLKRSPEFQGESQNSNMPRILNGHQNNQRMQPLDVDLPMTSSKRGYPHFLTLLSQFRSKRRHRLSVNNAMMTLSSLVLEDARQRARNNRNHIKYHMNLQG